MNIDRARVRALKSNGAGTPTSCRLSPRVRRSLERFVQQPGRLGYPRECEGAGDVYSRGRARWHLGQASV